MTLAPRDRDLLKRRLQAFRQLDRIVVGPEVHEEKSSRRLLLAKLYLASRYFLCRNYYRLTYTRQKEGAQTRRLGWVRIVIPLGNSYGPPLTTTPIAY